MFSGASQIVTWNHHWLVLRDLVERITEQDIVAQIFEQGPRFYRFKKTRYMPAEFPAPFIASATAWCAIKIATTVSSRP